MRTFVIGDIHGAHKALVQCLDRSGFDKKGDRLITIGDICDGWHEVKQCVEELLTIDLRIDILGNHDEWFQRYLKTGVHPDPLGPWKQGGRGTYDSYLPEGSKWLVPEDIPSSHWKFFLHQRLYYEDIDRNYFYVHAGFNRWKSIEANRRDSPEDFYWDRDLWDSAKSCGDRVKLKTGDDFDTIFIGHTALRDGFPICAGGVWNLDTGAGWKGKLTIMEVDTKEFWQSDLVTSLYPDEAARRF